MQNAGSSDNDNRHDLLLDDNRMKNQGTVSAPDDTARYLEPWSRLAQQLSPLIGTSGFCALFGRACRLAGPDLAWLAANPACKSPNAVTEHLRQRLAGVDADIAAAANAALLQTFTGLLASLIGEALTNRLLDSAAEDVHQQNTQQERK